MNSLRGLGDNYLPRDLLKHKSVSSRDCVVFTRLDAILGEVASLKWSRLMRGRIGFITRVDLSALLTSSHTSLLHSQLRRNETHRMQFSVNYF